MTDDKPSPQIKQPPVLLRETQAILKQIETLLGSKVVSYWNNARGSVCHNDVVALWEVLEKVGTHETLYLFIKSDGGNGQASLRMMNLLRKHAKRVVACFLSKRRPRRRCSRSVPTKSKWVRWRSSRRSTRR